MLDKYPSINNLAKLAPSPPSPNATLVLSNLSLKDALRGEGQLLAHKFYIPAASGKTISNAGRLTINQKATGT